MNRRKLLLYVAPTITTIAVLPALASVGSAAPTRLCHDEPLPKHGCKHYLRRHRFELPRE